MLEMNQEPRISIVTISFNQGQFLEGAIQSVINQDYSNIEYIVVDSGSTDGSREIIERYRNRIDKIVFEPDQGPADGLNKGFSFATGEIFGFLNSDDYFLPGALRTISTVFRHNRHYDVISGHALIIDERDRILRKCYSDKISLYACAYGHCALLQPSTFFKAETYKQIGGFNNQNTSNWDGELFIDMLLNNAKFFVIHNFLSAYRLHENSITKSKSLDVKIKNYMTCRFRKIMGREWALYDCLISAFFRVKKWIYNPKNFYERLRYGKIYGRK